MNTYRPYKNNRTFEVDGFPHTNSQGDLNKIGRVKV